MPTTVRRKPSGSLLAIAGFGAGMVTTLGTGAIVTAASTDRAGEAASLQASPDGLALYERFGFRQVGLLAAYVR